MARAVSQRSNIKKAADIVRGAAGRVIGRTRLQKIAYFLEVSALVMVSSSSIGTMDRTARTSRLQFGMLLFSMF
jgi:hypothetical protein